MGFESISLLKVWFSVLILEREIIARIYLLQCSRSRFLRRCNHITQPSRCIRLRRQYVICLLVGIFVSFSVSIDVRNDMPRLKVDVFERPVLVISSLLSLGAEFRGWRLPKFTDIVGVFLPIAVFFQLLLWFTFLYMRRTLIFNRYGFLIFSQLLQLNVIDGDFRLLV